jgi:hypothetical protein
MSPPLHPSILALLEQRHATPAAPIHAAVLAFERDFGGINLEEGNDPDAVWVLGAGACISSGVHEDPRGGARQRKLGLVPVAYSDNDMIAYLDGEGRAWFQDTIEHDDASQVALDGRTMVARLVLWDATFTWDQGKQEVVGAVGDRLAAALGVPAIAEASDAKERWWGDATTVILEQGDETTVASSNPKRIAKVMASVVKAAAKAQVTAKPAAAQPTKKPAAKKPVNKPVARKPVARKPVARKPVARKPVARKPVARKPVARKPVAKKPVAKKPVAKRPTAKR